MKRKHPATTVTLTAIICLLTVCTAHGQYKGGANDGNAVAKAVSLNALPSIYKGGNNDGTAKAQSNGRNPLINIYKGGANDGVSAAGAYQANIQPNIYNGGNNDGASMAAAINNNPLASIYGGGNDDGTAVVIAFNNNNAFNVYAGGFDDGFAMASSSFTNPVMNIYNGGFNDGYASIVVKGQNPMALFIPETKLKGEWSAGIITLNWETSNETSVLSYELERSAGVANRFVKIAAADKAVKQKLNSYYKEDHNTNDAGIYYYRVKVNLTDGKSVYSGIVQLDKTLKELSYTIYPNPGKGIFNIGITGVKDINAYRYRVIAGDGKLIRQGNIRNSVTSFDISASTDGIYYVQLFREGQFINTYKIILQH